jgi:hypothetical protein
LSVRVVRLGICTQCLAGEQNIQRRTLKERGRDPTSLGSYEGQDEEFPNDENVEKIRNSKSEIRNGGDPSSSLSTILSQHLFLPPESWPLATLFEGLLQSEQAEVQND